MAHVTHQRIFAGIYRFADGHNIEALSEIALNYIHDNFHLVSQEEEFQEINKDLLSELISSEYLRVDSEYQVFVAAMNWINYVDHLCFSLAHASYLKLPNNLKS